MKRLAACLIPALLLAAPACKKAEPPPPPPTTTTTTLPKPVGVTSVTLGNAVDATTKKVAAPMETFGAKDTLYASVETEGAGHAKLRALWSFVKAGKTAKVDETTIEFESSAPAVNEFHVAKPSGWPKGDYKVEIFLGDGAEPVKSATFKVG